MEQQPRWWQGRSAWLAAGLVAAAALVWIAPQIGSAVLEIESNVRSQRALQKIESGDLEGAIADLGIAIQKAPTHSEPYAWRGRAHFLLAFRGMSPRSGMQPSPVRPDELRAARADLDMALRNNPQNPNAHYFMAQLLWHEERHAEALSAFTRSLDLNPANAEVWWERANAHAWLGHHADAVADFDHAVSLRGSFDDFLWRGVSKIEIRDCAGGIADLRDAQRHASDDSERSEAASELSEANARCP